MRRVLGRTKELFVTTVATAGLLFICMSAVGPTAVSASAPAMTDSVVAACNNTFNGTKFPLEYRIQSIPSVNPIPANGSFTVQWTVTGVASAGFLNGVYT